MKKRTYSLAAVLAAAGIAAGCGGGGDDTQPKSDWIKQADAICKKGNDEINAEVKKQFSSGRPSSQDQEKFATDTLIPNIQDQVDQINDLTPPSPGEDQAKQVLDDAQNSIDTAKKDPTLLTDQAQGQDPFAKTNQAAKAFGLKVCGS